MSLFKKLSLGKRSMKEKLLIAFSLMSIIPLLLMVYFVSNYVFPGRSSDLFQTSLIVLLGLLIAWAGYVLAKELIIPIVNLSIETKIMAESQFDPSVLTHKDKELGSIADSVNDMTGKMRGYIGELQEYGKKTRALNVRIHKKVLTLTNLMRLGDIISSGVEFKKVTDFAVEGIAMEAENGFAAVFMTESEGQYALKSFQNPTEKDVDLNKVQFELPAIEKLLSKASNLVLDSSTAKKSAQDELRNKLGGINVILSSLKVNSRIVGIILLGDHERDVQFVEEDVEVMKAFTKELVLAYQSSQVTERIKGLEIVDDLTGLYTFAYLRGRMEEEITRAMYYQRPCSLMVVTIDKFGQYKSNYGVPVAEEAIQKIGKLLGTETPPVGKSARFGDSEFGILLPETNKRESLDLGEMIRKKVEELEIPFEGHDAITVSIGVGENPIDGATADEVIAKARGYTLKADEQGKKNVVVGE